jgi:hypothetical protein
MLSADSCVAAQGVEDRAWHAACCEGNRGGTEQAGKDVRLYETFLWIRIADRRDQALLCP